MLCGHDAGTYYGARLVLAPGAWAGPLVEKHFGVPLKFNVVKTVVNYFRWAVFVVCTSIGLLKSVCGSLCGSVLSGFLL